MARKPKALPPPDENLDALRDLCFRTNGHVLLYRFFRPRSKRLGVVAYSQLERATNHYQKIKAPKMLDRITLAAVPCRSHPPEDKADQDAHVYIDEVFRLAQEVIDLTPRRSSPPDPFPSDSRVILFPQRTIDDENEAAYG